MITTTLWLGLVRVTVRIRISYNVRIAALSPDSHIVLRVRNLISSSSSLMDKKNQTIINQKVQSYPDPNPN